MKSLKEFKKELGEVAKIAIDNKLKTKWAVGKDCEYPYDCLVIFKEDKEMNIFWDDDEQEWGIDISNEEQALKSIRVKKSVIKKIAINNLGKFFSLNP